MTDTNSNDPTASVDVAMLLAETSQSWSAATDRPVQWTAIATDATGFRCELTATIVDGGVEIGGRAIAWDAELAKVSQIALQRFLAAIDDPDAPVHYRLRQHHIEATALVALERQESSLPDVVSGVTTACRDVWRELHALTDTQVAAAYIEAIS